MPPKILSKSERGGVLPINAAARAASVKQPAPRLKLEIRRLPPGLTLVEFEEVLGDEWKLGRGKVDWREYRQGKLKSPGKVPEQSRCYMHVVNDAAVREFEQRFLAVVFHDKAGTYKHGDLKHLPPTLGYAPNQRVPVLAKQRADNRQGTIDQDSEFIAFLEAETQPIPRAAAIDSALIDKEDSAKELVKSTPLIDDLREKKANKAKAAAASKAEKKAQHNRIDSKDGAAVTAKDTKAAATKPDAKKVEQIAKEAAKASKKQGTISGQAAVSAATSRSVTPTPSTAPQILSSPARKKKGSQPSPKPSNATVAAAASTASTTTPAAQRVPPAQRPRRDAEGIKKMLQKDLGIKPKDVSAVGGSDRTKSSKHSNAAQPVEQTKIDPASTRQASTASSATSTTSAPTPTPALTKAFLKHANPSQGMTEELIKQALTQFGEMKSVTIDPRKGTAIAVFETLEGLKKAIQTKKVAVAEGAVEVMEFKDRSAGAVGGARGGLRGGRGRGGKSSPAASAGASATPAST